MWQRNAPRLRPALAWRLRPAFADEAAPCSLPLGARCMGGAMGGAAYASAAAYAPQAPQRGERQAASEVLQMATTKTSRRAPQKIAPIHATTPHPCPSSATAPSSAPSTSRPPRRSASTASVASARPTRTATRRRRRSWASRRRCSAATRCRAATATGGGGARARAPGCRAPCGGSACCRSPPYTRRTASSRARPRDRGSPLDPSLPSIASGSTWTSTT